MRWLALILFLSLPVLADVAPRPTPVALEHPGGNDKAPAAPMGVIEGGWAYVYAAYGAGLFGLVAYAASLFLRKTSEPPAGAP